MKFNLFEFNFLAADAAWADSNYSSDCLILYFELNWKAYVIKDKLMFGLFKKKSEKEKLQQSYAALMSEAHKLSHSNRKAADAKLAEAELVLKKIDELNWCRSSCCA